MFNLSNKTALVTGASGGIGAAIATALAQQGARVALSGTRVEALEELAEALPHNPLILPCDLSDSQAVETLIPSALQGFDGRLDILVNNAGLTRDGLIMRMKDEDWELVLNVNLAASFRLIRAATKPMMKARTGRIINISSIVGVTGNAGQANYSASKAGLIAMSKSLAQELASRNITVNCIAPGFIVSPMTDNLSDAQKQALQDKIPLARLGKVEDIGAATVYLASDEADFVTGQTLHINGGMAMV